MSQGFWKYEIVKINTRKIWIRLHSIRISLCDNRIIVHIQYLSYDVAQNLQKVWKRVLKYFNISFCLNLNWIILWGTMTSPICASMRYKYLSLRFPLFSLQGYWVGTKRGGGAESSQTRQEIRRGGKRYTVHTYKVLLYLTLELLHIWELFKRFSICFPQLLHSYSRLSTFTVVGADCRESLENFPRVFTGLQGVTHYSIYFIHR